ncbi:hypothetical protein C8R45DRAFT_1038851 [Mycena sanguinolenta]|nr:hypothetical protein C8R45DRAFT_1038851 [Mycena sanguinolenta]
MRHASPPTNSIRMPGKLRISRYPRRFVQQVYRSQKQGFGWSDRGDIRATKAVLWDNKAAMNRPARLKGRKPGRNEVHWEDDRDEDDETEFEESDGPEGEVNFVQVEREIQLEAIARPVKPMPRKEHRADGSRSQAGIDEERRVTTVINMVDDTGTGEDGSEGESELWDIQSEDWDLFASDSEVEDWEELINEEEAANRTRRKSYAEVLR